MILGVVFLLGCIALLIFLFISFRSGKKYISETSERFLTSAGKAGGAAGIGMFILRTILHGIKSRARKN